MKLALFARLEAKPGKENDVAEFLRQGLALANQEATTLMWFALRLGPTTFAIFEAFPNIAGRDAHVAGGGGDIFRDVQRMNDLLARPAHVQKVDVLACKPVFA